MCRAVPSLSLPWRAVGTSALPNASGSAADLQQLHKEALLTHLDQLLDLFRRAIRQLHAVDPLRDENLARRQVVVDGGHEHVLHLRPRTKR